MSAERRVIPDYKPLNRPQRPANRLPWFAAGLGIPLIAFGLIGPQKNKPDPEPPLSAAGESQALANPDSTSQPEPAAAGPAEPAPSMSAGTADDPPPAETGTELTLKIRRGDSLDRLFARHDLSRADLAAVIATDLGRKHLRLVHPGDEITVHHSAGRILTLERAVGLTESLRIERQNDDAFAARLVAREPERRPQEPAAAGPAEQAPSMSVGTPGVPDGAALATSDSAPPAETGSELTLKIRRGDSLDRLFARHDLSRSDLAALIATELGRKHLRLVRPGDEITIRHEAGRILTLEREVSLTESLRIDRQDDDAYTARLVARALERRPIVASGAIESSLFLAAADAGISDRTTMNLAGIFAWDVDFVLDIREGDGFRLVYEELWRDGERLGDGDILAAEFVNQGRAFQAVRFTDPDGRVDYYTPEGRSVRKAFVRAPLSFSRVSSNFNPRRRHPKLNKIRAHRGVDYAAPRGTPVKAAGDGKVNFRGRKGGYGNTVILQHGGNITTLYAHLSRFGNYRNGQRVRQGQIIGYVGATGLATGPHLHYEYRANGVHRNPRTVKLPDAEPIDPAYLGRFRTVADELIEQLDSRPGLVVAEAGRSTY